MLHSLNCLHRGACACPAVLKDEDRELPFLGNMLPLLVRGIGVHHSGLLPILKEVVELLFQEQLIKVGPLVQGRGSRALLVYWGCASCTVSL